MCLYIFSLILTWNSLKLYTIHYKRICHLSYISFSSSFVTILWKQFQQVALETVRCEELQLELSAALKSKYSTDSANRHQKSQIGNSGANTATITWAPAHTHSSQHKVIYPGLFIHDLEHLLDVLLFVGKMAQLMQIARYAMYFLHIHWLHLPLRA